MYEDWNDMKHALSRVAKGITAGALKGPGPLVFAVTGTGRVSTGALEVLKQLPHEFVDPLNLEALVTNDTTPCDRIYICHLRTEDLVARKDGQLFEAFDKADYYENPQNYTSVFAQRHLPFVSFLIQGVYWEPKYPRTLTIDDLRKSKLSGGRLQGVCDISADFEGSIEFTRRFTSIEEPFLLFDATTEEPGSFLPKISDATDNSILFHCVDHLPAEMPKEASNHFGEQLCPFIQAVAASDFSKPLE
jgi:alpha-aminoadipic semialdehyde synthase